MSLTVCTSTCAEEQRCVREIAAPFAAIARLNDVVIRHRSPLGGYIFPGISTIRARSRWCTFGPSGPEGLSKLTAAGIGDQKPVQRPPDLVAPVPVEIASRSSHPCRRSLEGPMCAAGSDVELS